MEIVQLPLKDIIIYARNPRKNVDAVDKVAASIKEFGFKQPIVVDSENVIVAGHTRYLAAQKLNLEIAPVVVAKDLSPAKIKAYRLADNRVAQESSWDDELLLLELEDLKSLEYDLYLTGFDEDELADIFEEEEQATGFTEEDDIPEVSEKNISLRGDVWLLGKHRLMCGDSTVITDVEKLMNGKKSPLLHADPPYGMGKEKDGVENDNLYEEELDKF